MRIDLPEPEAFKRMISEMTKQEITVEITGIGLDSREIHPGDLFVALSGENVNGHDFLGQAKENGAVAAVVLNNRDNVNLPQIEVEEPEILVGMLAAKWRTNFSLPVIGITGSNGKTTTKDLLMHIFSASHTVHGTRGNYNTHLGLPLTLLELTSHHTFSILEMGANRTGDIEYLSNLSLPRYGLITNIARAHLQSFGSIEEIARTKGELFASLPEKGTAFINMDDNYIPELDTPAKKVTYGFNPDCDFAADLHRDNDGLLTIIINGEEITLNSCDESFAKNSLAAATVSITQGISWELFQESILTIQPTKGRCEVTTRDGITVIDDSYNANLASAIAAVDLLLSLPVKGRRVIVFGDMLELGEISSSDHEEFGNKCARIGCDLLLCYGQESEVTADAARGKIDARSYSDKSELASVLKAFLNPGDAVLFKGSRGMAIDTIITEVFKE